MVVLLLSFSIRLALSSLKDLSAPTPVSLADNGGEAAPETLGDAAKRLLDDGSLCEIGGGTNLMLGTAGGGELGTAIRFEAVGDRASGAGAAAASCDEEGCLVKTAGAAAGGGGGATLGSSWLDEGCFCRGAGAAAEGETGN